MVRRPLPPGEYHSPLGATADEAMGPRAYDDNVGMVNASGTASPYTTYVPRGGSKNSAGDPSLGTAIPRIANIERSGARYRVHPATSMPNVPYAGATQANGRIITSRPAVMPDKRWSPSVVENFMDAEVIAGRAPGSSRLFGYTRPPRG